MKKCAVTWIFPFITRERYDCEHKPQDEMISSSCEQHPFHHRPAPTTATSKSYPKPILPSAYTFPYSPFLSTRPIVSPRCQNIDSVNRFEEPAARVLSSPLLTLETFTVPFMYRDRPRRGEPQRIIILKLCQSKLSILPITGLNV